MVGESEGFDMEKFRAGSEWSLVPQNRPRLAQAKTEPFLKGPIPMSWLGTATKLGGSSLAVGVCLWFQRGVLGEPTPIKVTRAVRRRLGLSPDQLQRGLKNLHLAGLIAIEQGGRGRCPVVRIVRPPGAS